MSDYLLGIDVGTSWVKAALVTPDGGEQPAQRVATPWRQVPTGAEADPEHLLETAIEAARRALLVAPRRPRVLAIGVTGMAESGVLLDAAGRPVAPVIAWHDRRGALEAERLAADLPGFAAHTGLPPSPTCSLVKHAHLAAEHGLRGRRWLSVPEWIVHRLGGEMVAELSLAARTGYLDLAPRAWWGEALAWAGAAPDFLPEPVVAGTSCGRARLPGARGAVLTVAGHDHTCAAHGAGATGEGVVLDSCGTAEALVRALPAPVAEAVVAAAVGRGLNVGWHVLPGVMSMIGGFPSGKLLAGIDLQSAAAEPVLAALASRAAALLAAMDDLAGHHARIVVTGGWAREAAFQRSRRRAFGEHVTAAAGEAGVLGAALLAGRAAGLIDTSSQVKR